MDFPQCLLFIIIPILDARSWIKLHENNFIIDFYFIARIMHRITYHTRTHIHNQKWPLLWARTNYTFLSAKGQLDTQENKSAENFGLKIVIE